MSTVPLVSVVIPVYNGERFIADAIRSVINQTVKDIETIVVDDGSTDGTRNMVDNFGPAVECASQENQGVSSARNRGIAAARGKYVAFLDADDVWLPTKLERQLDAFEQCPELSGVGAGLFITDEHLNIRGSEIPERCDAPGLLFVEYSGGLSGGSSLLARTDVIRQLGGYDPRLSTSADWDLALRIALRYPVACVREPLLYYRQHSASMHLGIARMEADMLVVLEKAFSGPCPPELFRQRARAYGNLYRVLAGSYWHAADWRNSVRCAVRSGLWKPFAVPWLVLKGFQGILGRRAA